MMLSMEKALNKLALQLSSGRKLGFTPARMARDFERMFFPLSFLFSDLLFDEGLENLAEEMLFCELKIFDFGQTTQ